MSWIHLPQNTINDINSERQEDIDTDHGYYRYLSFDNKTLEIKSALMDNNNKKKNKDGTNDIVVNKNALLQILELKNDFDIEREVYTRSTLNCWVAGHHGKKYYKEAFFISNKKYTSLANV